MSQNRTTELWLGEALIREIIIQQLPPGLPLREQDIADRYKVSRPSAREGLRLAAQAGFVEILPWRGARVANIDMDEFLDLLGLLEDMYARVAALAAERMAVAAIDELELMLPKDASQLPETSNKGKIYRISFTIGAFIGQHCGSPVTRRLFEHVGRLVLWQQRLHRPGTPETELESLHAHRLMVAAIKSRQCDVAAGAARAIILITRRTLHPEPIRESDHTVFANPKPQRVRRVAAGDSGTSLEN